jgi:hypothetical protein
VSCWGFFDELDCDEVPMRTFLTYSLLRAAIFAGCFGVLYVLFGSQVSIWLVAMLAIVFTAGLSWLLLRQRGAEAGAELAKAFSKVQNRIDESARREDAALDEQDGEESHQPPRREV